MLSVLIFLLVLFIVSWIFSAIIIYFSAMIMGRRRSFFTAMTAAFLGSLIYSLVFFLISSSFWSALVGGFAWLFVLKRLYRIGWFRAAITAFIIWFINVVAGTFLPLLL